MGKSAHLQARRSHHIVLYAEKNAENEITSPPVPESTDIEEFIGFRYVSPNFFQITGVKGNQIGIPADIFIESAKANPWLSNNLIKKGIDPTYASFNDWFSLAKSSETIPVIETLTPLAIEPVSLKGEKVLPRFCIKMQEN